MTKELDLLHEKIKGCRRCIHRENFPPTFTYLGTNNKMLLLGEAPAKNGWRISGKAWYEPNGKITASGKILKKLLKEIDLVLEDLSFTEAVKCTPCSPKHLKECGKNCQPFLIDQLKIMNPQIIIPLGVRATELLLPPFKKFSDVVGLPHKTKFGIVVPIYHPSPVSPIGYKSNLPIMQTIKKLIE
jgi:DNA polymerase